MVGEILFVSVSGIRLAANKFDLEPNSSGQVDLQKAIEIIAKGNTSHILIVGGKRSWWKKSEAEIYRSVLCRKIYEHQLPHLPKILADAQSIHLNRAIYMLVKSGKKDEFLNILRTQRGQKKITILGGAAKVNRISATLRSMGFTQLDSTVIREKKGGVKHAVLAKISEIDPRYSWLPGWCAMGVASTFRLIRQKPLRRLARRFS